MLFYVLSATAPFASFYLIIRGAVVGGVNPQSSGASLLIWGWIVAVCAGIMLGLWMGACR